MKLRGALLMYLNKKFLQEEDSVQRIAANIPGSD